VTDDSLSRRSLLRLDFGRFRAPERPDPEPVKAAIAWRWERGAGALHRAWEPLAPILCDLADVEDGTRVLDAGTGDGNVALEAADRGGVVTGVDIAPGQIDRVSDRARELALTGIWMIGDMEALPDLDESYDAVVSAFGLPFAPRPRRAVRELLRVLRPGGKLAVAAPGRGSLLADVIALAQDGPGALPSGFPSPVAWGDEEIARERIESVAPGTDVDVSVHTLMLRFESEAFAWAALSGPFGLAEHSRDRFADLVGSRSERLDTVEIAEPVTVIVARRPG
jgi:SAM-dependent methyltransferase